MIDVGKEENMNQEKIGNFIFKKRKEKKLTQEQLAEKLGVTDRAVSNWENGKNMPDLSLFKPLCDELDISINELMSGEEIDDKQYIKTLEENIVSMVSDLEKNKKKKWKILIVLVVLLFVLFVGGKIFYANYEINMKYDSRVMTCEFIDGNIQYSIKGQSVINSYHTCRELDGKNICFFNSKIWLQNKRRSNWEYSQSMATLLEGKDVIFGSYDMIENIYSNVDVYYTDKSIKKIEKASDKELKEIIKNSYLMCKSD